MNVVLLFAYYGPDYVRGTMKFGIESVEGTIMIFKLRIRMKVSWLTEEG